jgi:putative phosphoesterase
MRVAFLSDIHSNLYALESVLDDIKKREIEDIYCLGDIVGYHSFPNEVIDMVKENNIIAIKGNHDKDITELSLETAPKDIKRWTYQTLTTENLNYLKNLPEEKEIFLKDLKVKLVHGSPTGITNYLYEDSDESKEALTTFKGDILICAHTHFPYINYKENKCLMNTGSVGKPKIGEPKPSYIILNIENNSRFNAEIIYVDYDHKSASEDMLKKGLSTKHAEELILGKIL